MSERREPRVPVSIPVVAPGLDAPCVTKNLSLGGLFLLTRRRYPVGENVSLKLIYQDLNLDVEARVTHLQSDGVGFAFVSASTPLRNTIRAILDKMVQGSVSRDGAAPPPSSFWSPDGSVKREARLLDVSAKGAYVAGPGPAVGAEILFYIPGFTPRDASEPSEVRGSKARVVRSSEEGFGMEFVNASAEFRMALEELIILHSK